jgi:hypothetical protein
VLEFFGHEDLAMAEPLPISVEYLTDEHGAKKAVVLGIDGSARRSGSSGIFPPKPTPPSFG